MGINNIVKGGWRKSVGVTTGSKWKDLTLIKTKPIPTDPRTDSQVFSRSVFSFFSTVGSWFCPSLRFLDNYKTAGMSYFNYFIKNNITSFNKNFYIRNSELDEFLNLENVIYTSGDAPYFSFNEYPNKDKTIEDCYNKGFSCVFDTSTSLFSFNANYEYIANYYDSPGLILKNLGPYVSLVDFYFLPFVFSSDNNVKFGDLFSDTVKDVFAFPINKYRRYISDNSGSVESLCNWTYNKLTAPFNSYEYFTAGMWLFYTYKIGKKLYISDSYLFGGSSSNSDTSKFSGYVQIKLHFQTVGGKTLSF